MSEKEIRCVKFQIHEMNETEGVFEGYASVFNVLIEDYNEVVEPGAFKQTLRHNGGVVPILYHHDAKAWVGVGLDAKEDNHGLWVRGKLAVDESPRAREVWGLMKLAKQVGMKTGLSIGFRAIKDQIEKGVRKLKEIAWLEYSITPFPANQFATVTEVRAVVPYQSLPLADVSRPWDRAKAEKRVRAWAGGGDDLENMDWRKYRKAFLWYDSEAPENITSYKLQIGDIIDGELYAIPRAIFAAAAAIQGARGGVNIPEADKQKVKHHLERYYQRLDRVPPWQAQSLTELVGHIEPADIFSLNDDLALLLNDYRQGDGASLGGQQEGANSGTDEARALYSLNQSLDQLLAQLKSGLAKSI